MCPPFDKNGGFLCQNTKGGNDKMVKIFKTDNKIVNEIENYETGSWIQMTNPTIDECMEIVNRYEIDIADVRAALDDEESSRVDIETGYTLILVDIPAVEIRHDNEAYTTMPLGIIIAGETIITVCAVETPVLQYFEKGRVRDFSTKKQMRFVYQILYRASMVYQIYLRIIDKKRTEIEERVSHTTEDKDLINLHELESNLVYFATSLRANGVVLDRLSRYGGLKQFPEDKELIEDVIVENKQAIEMTAIYRDIINGTRELLSTIINNRLNNVMKYLASITIVMAIPTIISGIFGMNVKVPFANWSIGFPVVCGSILCISFIAIFVLHRRKML